MKITAPLLALAAASNSSASLPVHTVSGFSAGGDMAADHFVAFSSVVKGVGIVSGSPYGCAVLNDPIHSCAHYNSRTWDVSAMWKYTEAKGSRIDALSNMRKNKVYLFQGTQDSIVDMRIATETKRYFEHYMPSSQIKTKFDIKTGHNWVTLDPREGHACKKSGYPMVAHCNYDMAEDILKWTGAITSRATRGKVNSRHFYKVDQRKYAPSGHTASSISMANDGFVYVPSACRSNPSGCSIHVAYHGCTQSYSYVGMDFIEQNGLNEWGEKNQVIILYPQSYNNLKLGFNFNTACWDWWGKYGAGPHFDDHGGWQLQAVMNMLKDMSNIARYSSALEVDATNSTSL